MESLTNIVNSINGFVEKIKRRVSTLLGMETENSFTDCPEIVKMNFQEYEAGNGEPLLRVHLHTEHAKEIVFYLGKAEYHAFMRLMKECGGITFGSEANSLTLDMRVKREA